jgi:predicted enzyme related to lactoylglutathione lyase
MAVFTDPTGAVCGIWQPGTFAGADLVNESGTFGWNELGTRDTAKAKEFYGAVFGWGADEQDMGEMGTYTTWKVGEEMVGGMFDITGVVPDEVPAHWLVYFTVEDLDASMEKVKGGGGDLRNGPIEIPIGRFAVVADQFGAVFAVMQRNEETPA